MGKAVRVNLSVPVAIDDVLTRLSAATGISKASLVMASVSRSVPYWRADLAKLERVEGSGSAPVDLSGLTRTERKRLKRDGRLKKGA